MARPKNPNSCHHRNRLWLSCLYGTLPVAWLAYACGESTERVISKIPETVYASASGGATGGQSASAGGNLATGGTTSAPATGGSSTGGSSTGGSPTGGSPAGGSATGGAPTGGTSAAATGPKLSAVGTPVGYAAQGAGGTTGGGLQVPIRITDCKTLPSLLMDAIPHVIVVDGKIDCSGPAQAARTCEIPCDSNTGDTRIYHRWLDPAATDCSGLEGASATTPIDASTWTTNHQSIKVASNKTLLGSNSTATISGANLQLVSTASNIIIQNLTFTNVNPQLAEAGDAITIDGANHVWIDHCGFNLISDGFVDMPSPSSSTTSATFVTVSWSYFDGRNDAACGKQHNYSNTVENATVTFHHNFWDHTLGCSPKITKISARAHLYNNYWLNALYYSIGVDKSAQALIEYNDFNESKRPYWGMNTCIADGLCFMSDSSGSNTFEGISANAAETKSVGGTVTAFPYTVTPTSATTAKTAILLSAGPTLTIP